MRGCDVVARKSVISPACEKKDGALVPLFLVIQFQSQRVLRSIAAYLVERKPFDKLAINFRETLSHIAALIVYSFKRWMRALRLIKDEGARRLRHSLVRIDLDACGVRDRDQLQAVNVQNLFQ